MRKKLQIAIAVAFVLVAAHATGLSFRPSAIAQQLNQLTIGNFTVSVPSSNPAVTVTTPARSGTLALRDEVVTAPTQPVQASQKGSITLVGGRGTAVLTGLGPSPICVVSDLSGNSVQYTIPGNVLTVQGIGPTIHYICQ